MGTPQDATLYGVLTECCVEVRVARQPCISCLLSQKTGGWREDCGILRQPVLGNKPLKPPVDYPRR